MQTWVSNLSGVLLLGDAHPISLRRLPQAADRLILGKYLSIKGAPPMASSTIPEKFLDLLTTKKPLANIATVMPDGSPQVTPVWFEDRKSTRLNSSHITISYAVFC